jgi:uncharacterized membrane protein
LQRSVPWVFLLYALATSLFLVFNLPPFQGPDEFNHFRRAELLSHGRLVGERYVQDGATFSGGPVDSHFTPAAAPFNSIPFRADGHADARLFEVAGPVRWGGRVVLMPFENTSFLPPLLSLPASLAIVAGKAFDLTVLDTLTLARLANALASIAIAFAALCLAGEAAASLAALLLLPMSLSLYAVVSQDGMIIATTALAGALVLRARQQGRPLADREAWGAALCLGLVGMVKLPYAVLPLLLLGVPAASRRVRAAAAGVGTLLGLGWGVATMLWVQVPQAPEGVNAGAQLAYVLGHPGAVLSIAAATLGQYGVAYGAQFIGILGWLDTPLPAAFYPLAALGVAAAALRCLPPQRILGWDRFPWALAAVLLLSVGLLFGGLYAIWTPVGHPRVEGVQGRYFLPLALLALTLAQPDRRRLLATRWGRLADRATTAFLLALPMVSLLVVTRAVILRYYLD